MPETRQRSPAPSAGKARGLTAADPVARRLAGWLSERFPPAPYVLLVTLFFGSAVRVAAALAGGPVPARAWLGAPVVLLAFFHLRVFDEHKDFDRDRITHPQRLLSRGVVTLPLLARCGLGAIALEAVLSALVGPGALLAWAAMFVFTLAMRVEFGVGAWLNRHLVLYAITHNPVVALLAVYAWATTGLGWVAAFGWYLGAVSLGSLAFEVGRKTRLPHEEIPGVDSYSSVLGRRRAGSFLRGICLGAAACAGALLARLGAGVGPWVLLGLAVGVGWAAGSPRSRAKHTDAGASGFLLAMLLALGWAAW